MAKLLGIMLALFAVGCLAMNPGARYRGYSGYTVNDRPAARTFMPETYPVWIDKNFTADQRSQIHLAVAEWNFALNGYRTYAVVSDDYDMDVSVLEYVNRTNQGLITLAVHEDDVDAPPGVLAWVDRLRSPVIFFAVDRLGSRDVKLIMMHEMGHTLGVDHTQVSGSLMSKFYQDQAGCIDQVTIQALASTNRVVKWDHHHMNYCELP